MSGFFFDNFEKYLLEEEGKTMATDPIDIIKQEIIENAENEIKKSKDPLKGLEKLIKDIHHATGHSMDDIIARVKLSTKLLDRAHGLMAVAISELKDTLK